MEDQEEFQFFLIFFASNNLTYVCMGVGGGEHETDIERLQILFLQLFYVWLQILDPKHWVQRFLSLNVPAQPLTPKVPSEWFRIFSAKYLCLLHVGRIFFSSNGYFPRKLTASSSLKNDGWKRTFFFLRSL